MIRSLVLFCCLLFTLALQAQVDWTVSANARSVAAGEHFEVSYTLKNTNGGNFREPKWKYFKKLRGPSRKSHTELRNGRASSSNSFVYTVVAEKTGKFPLPKAKITVGGKVYETTNRLTIEVVKGKVRPAGGKEKDPVLLNVTISDTTAFIGQPLEFEIKIHSLRSELDFDVLTAPNFDNFYKESNERKTNRVYKEVINGQTYFTKVLGHFTLYPLQEGNVTLDAYRMTVNMATAQQSRRRSIFDFRPRNYESFSVASTPFNVSIGPLPSGAPANFSGAVGSLDVSCKVDRTILTTDDVVSLEMKIFGKGDTKQIQPPKLASSDSLEIYPPKLKEEREEERSWGMEKVKVYEYAILPKYKGSYQLEPSFSYFDSDSLKYVNKTCQLINIRVTQGMTTRQTITKQPVIDDGLKDLVTADTFKGLPGPGLSQGKLWLTFGGFALAFFAMIGYRNYQENLPEADHGALRAAAAQKVALHQLASAKEHLNQEAVKPFYESLSSALYGYLFDKLKLPPADHNLANIRQTLIQREVPESEINTFAQLVQSAQMALYGGSQAKENMPENYEASKQWIIKMEEWLER